ncbi:MAG: hypothetical protein ACRD5L_06200, partial [Bryobacteraceae bacterium]
VYAMLAPGGAACDGASDPAWLVSFDAAQLRLAGAAAVANSGAAVSADAAGNLYFSGGATGPRGATAAVSATAAGSVGAGAMDGMVVLPDGGAQAPAAHLAVAADANGNIYLLNRDALGGTQIPRAAVVQEFDAALVAGNAAPETAYFQGTVFFSAANDSMRAYALAGGRLQANPASMTRNVFGNAAAVAISAKGGAGGIVWAVEGGSAAVLHAYDATDLSRELYNSTQASTQATGARDALGAAGGGIMPVVANGRVYVVTTGGVAVYGLRQ